MDAKIVAFDLEIVPDMPEARKVWPQLGAFPGRTLRATITSTCCFGYSILGDDSVKCISAWDFPEWETNINDDRALCEAAYEILKDADGVITHNGKRFDWKYLQTRLLKHRIGVLPKINHIDTKTLSSSNLFFFSNKLDLIAEALGCERKLDHEGWDLWVKVCERDPEAMQKMTDYCKQDVSVLKQIYSRLLPFSSGPNQNLHVIGGSKNLCPNCGSTRLRSEGIRSTKTRTYRRYNCTDCGTWSHTDLNDRLPRTV